MGAMAAPESDPRADLAYTRTHLSNQRTFAAWLRTGLAIAGAGHLVAWADTSAGDSARGGRPLVAIALVAVGAAVMAFGAFTFHHTGRTLASAGSPPAALTNWIVYGSAAALSAVVVAALVMR